jgi:hypothetical protein
MTERAAPGGRAWAWGILTVAVAFSGLTLGFVAFAFSQRVDLVSRDYYRREIEHQRQIERAARAMSLSDRMAWSVRREGTQLVFQFPQSQARETVKGTFHFYRPSDAGLDRELAIALDENGQQRLASDLFEPGRWRVKIDWSLGPEEYYSEISLNVE